MQVSTYLRENREYESQSRLDGPQPAQGDGKIDTRADITADQENLLPPRHRLISKLDAQLSAHTFPTALYTSESRNRNTNFV